MTTTNQIFTASGTFTAPATLLNAGVSIVASGSVGGGFAGGNGAVVSGGLAMAPSGTLSIVIGYHLGGAAGGSGSGAGGSSAAVLQSAVLQIEAGGGGGSSAPTVGTSPGGTGGQPGGDAPGGAGTGANSATPGAGVFGGSSGTFGGGSGSTNGGAANTSAGGGGGGYAGGGGGGGGIGGGGASSFFSASVSIGATPIANGANSGAAQVVVTYTYADAPLSPSLSPLGPFGPSPVNGQSMEISSPAPTFQFTYNPGTDSGAVSTWAMRRKVGAGAYNYWTATGTLLAPGGNWTSTTPVWNSAASFLTLVAGTTNTWQYVFPAAAWTDGTTYNWSFATAEANYPTLNQGPFAGDLTVIGLAAPVIAITSPGATASTSVPAIAWSFAGTTQTTFRVVYYTAAQAAIVGFTPGVSPSTYDSSVQTSAAHGFATPSAAGLQNGVTYAIYVIVTETGGVSSPWVSVTTTLAFAGPAGPTLTAVAANDALTGQPIVVLSATSQENILTAVDSSLEGSIGTWISLLNATLASSTTQALDQTHSLSMTAVASGAMTAGVANSAYAVSRGSPYSARAAIRANGTGRSCRIAINWYINGLGTPSAVKPQSLGAAVVDNSTGWVQLTVADSAPSDGNFAQVIVLVTTASGTPALGEIHFVDTIGLFATVTAPAWSIGGVPAHFPNVLDEYQFSDDGGVTWADVRASEPIVSFLGNVGSTSVTDYESPPVVNPTPNLLKPRDALSLALSAIAASYLPNPGAEGVLGSWVAGANVAALLLGSQYVTPTPTSTQFAVLQANGGTPSMTAAQGSTAATATPVSAGTQVTAVASLQPQFAPLRNVTVGITWLDALGNTVGSPSVGVAVAEILGRFVQASCTATCPAGAVLASVTVTVTTTSGNLGGGEAHFLQHAGLFYNPTGAAQPWVAPVLNLTPRLYRARGIDNTVPTAIATGPWSNSARPTPGPTTNAHWYLMDPTQPLGAIQFDSESDWQPAIHEESTRYYPAGRPFGIKSSSGTKGIGGTVEALVTSQAAWQALATLLATTGTLFLVTPFSAYYVSLEGDRTGDALYTTVGRSDFAQLKHSFSYLQTARP